ncbi:MAG: aminotransferase class I/II-fold pyridoxal phosphate-dependent enzyme, partial [Thermoplasmata archaeon]
PRRSADAVELRKQIGELLGVSAARVFMTHGATEANSLAVTFLARRRSGRTPRCRVELPEYPPLFDLAHWAGFRVGGREGSTDLAIVSQPRNPVGDLWSTDRLEAWAEGARALIVDESFREFTRARSVQRLGLRGLWTTGTFTKAYGADDLRVGFVAAPANERASFARYHGLATDELPPYSVTGALATLAARERILRDVRAVVDRNQALWRRSMPGGPPLAAPIAFDDPVPRGGDPFSRQCLAASVLVCPGSYFGRPSGVRVGLTRRSFPRDLAAYLRVRTARAPRGQRGSPDRRKVRRVDRSTG